jgi:hypothetical protein
MADRQVAPKVETRTAYVDKRAEMIDRLDRENPQWKHSFRRADVAKADLDVNGQEIVYEDTYVAGGKKGKPLGWRRDIIARMPREAYDEKRRQHCDMAATDVEALYNRKSGNEAWKDNKPGKRVAKPKKLGEQDGG